MESKGRRTEIQIETHEVKVIRLRKPNVSELCGRLGEIEADLTPDEKAEIVEITQLVSRRKHDRYTKNQF